MKNGWSRDVWFSTHSKNQQIVNSVPVVDIFICGHLSKHSVLPYNNKINKQINIKERFKFEIQKCKT